MLQRLQELTTRFPDAVRKPASMAMSFGYGSLFGTIYGLLRARKHNRSALADGAALGATVYAAGYLGWLPALGLTKPVWKQSFPEVVGELSRHVVYGIATAAAYEMIDCVM